MIYYADLANDLPVPYKRKRIIFYRQGLKIYGLIPYILQRKLKAQFFSGTINWGQVHISAGSLEENWTAVPYQQKHENMSALLDWLSADKGFEAAIASQEDWGDDIFSPNVSRTPPTTWYPAGNEARQGFLQIAGGTTISRNDVLGLLVPPSQREME